MCGIVGIIGNMSDKESFLKAALLVQKHRGPDDAGIAMFGELGGFGHNRLSILDLTQLAKQPMWDKTNRFCLSFNGEIYNFKKIKQALISLGHAFCTNSDSEVLIEAWAEWGVEAVQRFTGMFAFSVWDNQKKELFLVRDRLGEKPLYYTFVNDGIIFASELKGLLASTVVEKKLSLSALNHYLSFGYTNTSDCIFENIYKLPSASYLSFNYYSKKRVIKTYWQLAYYFNNKSNLSFLDATEKLNDLLTHSVSQQRVSDVPLGAFLSGGIDSSTIVKKMSEQSLSQTHTFSIGFSQKTYSELRQSQIVADQLAVAHHTKVIGQTILDDIQKIINTFDEPFADTSLIPTYYLCQFARQHIKVSLSGDGGDELFGGYDTYQADRYRKGASAFPFFLKKLFILSSRQMPTSFDKVSWDYKIKKFSNGLLLSSSEAHLSWREHFDDIEKNMLLNTDFKEMMRKDEANMNWFQDVSDCHYLDQAMYVDMKTWLVDDILVKVDRASMAHSLEVRAPFLDHRMVEFAASLPIEYKIRGRQGKRILKASQQNHLPNDIIYQEKKGFNSPISHWLKNELYSFAREVTLSNKLSTWFNHSTIEALWVAHQKGTCDNGYRLFNLLCFGLWCEKYL